MKKTRYIPRLLLLALLLFSLLGSEAQASSYDDLYESVEKQVSEYSKSIAKNDAGPEAVVDMLMYSVLSTSDHYQWGEAENLTAALMNSNLMQEYLSLGITNSITLMQELGLDSLYAFGGPAWYDYGCRYRLNAYKGNEPVAYNDYGSMAFSQDIYGTPYFAMEMNENDQAMALVVGSADMDLNISIAEVKDSKIIYEISVKVYDGFDFNCSYEEEGGMGYDTSSSDRLTELGSSSLNSYTWESVVTFYVEAPIACDHVQGNYQWTLEKESGTLVSANDETFLLNETEKLTGLDDWNRPVTYYKLKEPVTLYHDQPWVMEYEGTQMGALHLVTRAASSSCIPTFHHENAEVYAFYNHNMIFRLENKIQNDGSNRVYITISYIDEAGQEHVIVNEETIEDYAARTNKASSLYGFDSEEDFRINYIGTKSIGFSANTLKFSIWTNGEEGEPVSSYEYKMIQGHCGKANVYADVCVDCNHAIVKSTEGGDHVYGNYVSNNDATCTQNGTKTATCKYCGLKDTVTDEGSALGHHTKKIRDCAATCTKAGYIGGTTCTRCKVVLKEKTTIPAKGHDFGQWIVTKKSTCQTEGLERRDCKVCTHYEERTKAVSEHSWGTNYIVEKPATFEEKGTQSIRCTVCNKLKKSVSIYRLQAASCSKTVVCTGTKAVPVISITNTNGKKLIEGTDYTYVVRNIRNAIVKEPKAIGDYIIDITYVGKYTGNTKLNYSIVPAAPEKLTVELTAHDDVKLTWTKSKTADGYLVYYKKAAAKTYKLFGTTTSTTMTIKNLDDNVKYNFKVVSYGMSNGQQIESRVGRIASISTLQNLAAPKTVTLKLTGHDDIKVTWSQVKNAKGYFVYYKESVQTFYKTYKITTGTSLVLKNLIDDVEYDVKVVPYGVSGKAKVQSDNGKEKSILTLENLNAPKNLKLKATGKNIIKVTWERDSFASGYFVYYKTAGMKDYKLYKTVSGTSISITGLKKNTKYTVKVVPYGVSGKLKVQSDNFTVKTIKTSRI